MGGPRVIGAAGAGSPACTPWCPGGNLPESAQISLAGPSPAESRSVSLEQDPALKPGLTLMYPQVISLGMGVSNQSRLALLAAKVMLQQFCPHSFSFFILRAWYIL